MIEYRSSIIKVLYKPLEQIIALCIPYLQYISRRSFRIITPDSPFSFFKFYYKELYRVSNKKLSIFFLKFNGKMRILMVFFLFSFRRGKNIKVFWFIYVMKPVVTWSQATQIPLASHFERCRYGFVIYHGRQLCHYHYHHYFHQRDFSGAACCDLIILSWDALYMFTVDRSTWIIISSLAHGWHIYSFKTFIAAIIY